MTALSKILHHRIPDYTDGPMRKRVGLVACVESAAVSVNLGNQATLTLHVQNG